MEALRTVRAPCIACHVPGSGRSCTVVAILPSLRTRVGIAASRLSLW